MAAKSLVVELAPPHVQSAWDSRGERVWAARLAAYCNYFSKKKKKKKRTFMACLDRGGVDTSRVELVGY